MRKRKIRRLGWFVVILAAVLEYYSFLMMNNVCPPYHQTCMGYYYEKYVMYRDLLFASFLMGIGGIVFLWKAKEVNS